MARGNMEDIDETNKRMDIVAQHGGDVFFERSIA